jgi:hypothetical protein
MTPPYGENITIVESNTTILLKMKIKISRFSRTRFKEEGSFLNIITSDYIGASYRDYGLCSYTLVLPKISIKCVFILFYLRVKAEDSYRTIFHENTHNRDSIKGNTN